MEYCGVNVLKRDSCAGKEDVEVESKTGEDEVPLPHSMTKKSMRPGNVAF